MQKKAEVSYSDVKTLFLGFGRKINNFKVNLHNAKKRELLSEKLENGETLLYLTVKGLKSVKDLIGETVGIRTWVVEAGQVYSGKKLLQEVVLPHIGSYLMLCDPYIGTRTLDFINSINHKCKIKLLTQVIDNKNSFQRELTDFTREYSDLEVEVRIYSKSTLHDRYMISDGSVWSIGTSLKDLGNKDTIVTRLGDEVKFAIEEIFEKRWQDAVPLE